MSEDWTMKDIDEDKVYSLAAAKRSKGAANSDWDINDVAMWSTHGVPVGHYSTLRTVLEAAFDHAAVGKGKERHARDLPFDKQPMLETTRLVGPGFPLGQAIKKAGEAAGMIERGELGAAEAECLGAINYLAGAVVWMRERARKPYVVPDGAVAVAQGKEAA